MLIFILNKVSYLFWALYIAAIVPTWFFCGWRFASYLTLTLPLFLYLIISILEYLHNRPVSSNAFFEYDHKLDGTYSFFATMVATNIGLASSLVFTSYLGYLFKGSGFFWGTLTWVLGILLFAFVVRYLMEDGLFKDIKTLPDFIVKKYASTDAQRRSLRLLTAIPPVLLFGNLIVSELYVGKLLLQALSFPYFLEISLLFAIIFTASSYIILTGYLSVVRTDKIQVVFLFLTILSIFVIVFSSTTPKTLKAILYNDIVTGTDLYFVVSLFCMSLFYQFSTMDMWQRCIATSGVDTSKILYGKDVYIPSLHSVRYFFPIT